AAAARALGGIGPIIPARAAARSPLSSAEIRVRMTMTGSVRPRRTNLQDLSLCCALAGGARPLSGTGRERVHKTTALRLSCLRGVNEARGWQEDQRSGQGGPCGRAAQLCVGLMACSGG